MRPGLAELRTAQRIAPPGSTRSAPIGSRSAKLAITVQHGALGAASARADSRADTGRSSAAACSAGTATITAS